MSSLKEPVKVLLFFNIVLLELIFYTSFELFSVIFLSYILIKIIFLIVLYLQKYKRIKIAKFKKEESLLIRMQYLQHLPDRELYMSLEFPEDRVN